jgi:hypothetical protein
MNYSINKTDFNKNLHFTFIFRCKQPEKNSKMIIEEN